MKKVLLFSFFLVSGLVVSQILPSLAGDNYSLVKTVSNTFLFVCLSFIMINVGREFEIDKTRWKSYTEDYFIAMATAAFPWIFVALYYMFILLPEMYWGQWDAWKENLLLSRFAAPTSAGILFTMLAAAGLKASWVYKKVQVLAIFDDLDTILLMIPLQIMMIGLRWQLGVIILVVVLLLILGWKKMGSYNVRQDWKAILTYAVVTFAITQIIYLVSKKMYGEDGSIHIEVLLPAFVVGMIMRHKHIDTKVEHRVADLISYLFMFLVGVSMPVFLGIDFAGQSSEVATITGAQPMMSWPMIILHVVVVSFLSNIGKLFPIFFYRERRKRERLALSIGMFTRGEVGAGVIFIALGYNLGGPALIISVLTIVFNLILTGIFVVWVEKLTRSAYKLEQAEKAEAVGC
ncbi:cation:proton antiporter family protein [Parabacteroides chinchillae]|uniref:Transporter, CPA2 family n=1 Tax=Parabacteroides chinchillae TaxID=871327 RepID=A0A8G2BTI4_9BACT|nr:cation:proton antiporter [Parabacteroides chinchillae]SEF41170.1 transporter, CPA2 family [Parabacteroides chinchillae]